MSEQEQLAKLIADQNAPYPEDYTTMLVEGLASRIGNVSQAKVAEVSQEIISSGNYVSSSSPRAKEGIKLNCSAEKLLINLYDIRDGLVSIFETNGTSSTLVKPLTEQINKVDSCIRMAGGEIDTFSPMRHVSGLQAPNLFKNAEKVIETTIQCYKLGRIEDAKLSKDGREISIVFSGRSGNTEYRAIGTVSSDSWSGNEAIDYIYAPEAGEMSIKAFEGGRWIDKRSTKNYEVYWNLEEGDVLEEIADSDASEKEEKVVQSNTKNNISDEEEEIASPIK